MKRAFLIGALLLAVVQAAGRPYTLIIAADGDAAWTKTVRSRMLPGREAIVHDFGTNTLAETLASGKWQSFLADINDGDVVLLALGRNGLTADMTAAVSAAAGKGAYVGVVPVWSSDPEAFSRNVRDMKRHVDAATGYRNILLREQLPADDSPGEFARALLADAYMWLYAIQRCGFDMTWYQNEVMMRYAKIRRRDVKPVKAGELRLTPTFVSCGVDFGSQAELKDASLFVDGRHYPFPYFKAFGEHRGSLLRLREDTDYTFEIRSAGRTVKTGAFRTWKSTVPIAKTIEIDPATATFPIVINASGSPDGWIRYVTKGALPLVNGTAKATIVLKKGASHVLLDGITFRGGRGANVITLKNTHHVRIINCEISGWGRTGTADYFRAGQYWTADGALVNFDGAIDIGAGCVGTVVERCWIHDPISRANGWFYSHPAGPEAITVSWPEHSTVIRWCDFTGSDDKMWNDAVEGAGNFQDDGGFNRDADIYGNFMIGANDDSIELDGGMRNVRCFDNRFENSGCGVSIQGCMVSPVYVFNNLFTGLGAEHGITMQTIKTSSYDRRCNGSWSYITDNTLWGDGTGIELQADGIARFNVIGNRFCGNAQQLTKTNALALAAGRIEGNRFGVEIDEKDLDASYPKRPLPFVLDRARFSGITLKGGVLSENDLAFTAIHDGKGAAVSFRVVQNAPHDWFMVSPAHGTIAEGACVPFTIRLDPTKMTRRRHYRGSFLVRTPNGLSRPVSLAIDTDFVQPLKPEMPADGFAAYHIPEKTLVVNGAKFPKTTFTFSVPKDGGYFLLFRVRAAGQTIDGLSRNPPRRNMALNARLDNERNFTLQFPATDYAAWYHGARMRTQVHELKAGHHTLTIWGCAKNEFVIEGFAVTDSLGAFEPR